MRKDDPGQTGLLPDPLSRRGFLTGAAVLLAGVAGTAGALRVGGIDAAQSVQSEDALTAADDLHAQPELSRTAKRMAAQPNAIFRVETDKPLVALTFDDGPDPAYTPQVLDLLKEHGAKATFFAVGVNALAHPELLRSLIEAGHEVGNHTRTHASLDRLTPEAVAAEIDGGTQDLIAAGVSHVNLFRPPRGLTSDFVGVYTNFYGYRTVFWDVPIDHYVRRLGLKAGVEKMLSKIEPGSIILGHDGGHTSGERVIDRSSTLATLPLILEGLASRGLTSVSLPTLLGA